MILKRIYHDTGWQFSGFFRRKVRMYCMTCGAVSEWYRDRNIVNNLITLHQLTTAGDGLSEVTG